MIGWHFRTLSRWLSGIYRVTISACWDFTWFHQFLWSPASLVVDEVIDEDDDRFFIDLLIWNTRAALRAADLITRSLERDSKMRKNVFELGLFIGVKPRECSRVRNPRSWKGGTFLKGLGQGVKGKTEHYSLAAPKKKNPKCSKPPSSSQHATKHGVYST